MNRFFKVPTDQLNSIREQVMIALEQPNSRADEPWVIDGIYNDGVHGYIALGSHHTSGEFFGPLFDQLITLEGVQEITQEEFYALF